MTERGESAPTHKAHLKKGLCCPVTQQNQEISLANKSWYSLFRIQGSYTGTANSTYAGQPSEHFYCLTVKLNRGKGI